MTSWKSILILFIVFTIYLNLGMIAFHYLETDNEANVRKDTRNFKEEILANFTCLTSDDLEALITSISYAIGNGVDPASNVTNPSNWGYESSLFFSGTVITTIGYGHISPNTRYGRSFCIIYALIGIPICGILLSALGDQFKKQKDKILRNSYGKFDKKWQKIGVNICLICVTGILFFIVIPAIIIGAIEGWSYDEAWYYCLITLTTIGFGDFVAGQNPEIQYPPIYKTMVYCWILLGLVYLATIIQDISDALSSHVEKIQAKSKDNKIDVEKIQAESKESYTDESAGAEELEDSKL